MNPRRQPDRDPAGQHRLVGWALVVFGCFCLVLSGALVVFDIKMQFIDAPTMAIFSIGMAMVGGWQIRLGDEYDE